MNKSHTYQEYEKRQKDILHLIFFLLFYRHNVFNYVVKNLHSVHDVTLNYCKISDIFFFF